MISSILAHFTKGATIQPPTLDDIPELVDQMLFGTYERSTEATKRIYQLCDVQHQSNRIPMVCDGKYYVLTPLAQCLTLYESGDGGRRRLACLALNNLSVPTENKKIMASKDIIGGLCKVIAEEENQNESYLCFICLMNLSFLDANLTTIIQYSPLPRNGKQLPPLEDPESLLCVVETFLNTSVSKSGTNTSEGVHWACGLIKNLTKIQENADLMAKTDIPKRLVEFIRSTTTAPSRWTPNSLEAFAFTGILNLAQWSISRKALMDASVANANQLIIVEEGCGDLQGLKAALSSNLPSVNEDSFACFEKVAVSK